MNAGEQIRWFQKYSVREFLATRYLLSPIDESCLESSIAKIEWRALSSNGIIGRLRLLRFSVAGLKALHAAQPDLINVNHGALLRHTFLEQDMGFGEKPSVIEAIQFLLDCPDFDIEACIVDIIEELLELDNLYYDCHYAYRHVETSWFFNATTRYQVMCMMLSCERLMASGRFIRDVIRDWMELSPTLLELVLRKATPAHLAAALDLMWSDEFALDGICLIKRYAPSLVSDEALRRHCRYTEKCMEERFDSQMRFIDTNLTAKTRYITRQALLIERVVGIACALAPLALPVYVLLEIIKFVS